MSGAWDGTGPHPPNGAARTAEQLEREGIKNEPPRYAVDIHAAVRMLAKSPGDRAALATLRAANEDASADEDREKARADARNKLGNIAAEIGEAEKSNDKARIRALGRQAVPLAAIACPPEIVRTSYGLSDVFGEDDPTPWLCEAMHFCPGRVPMFIGPKGGGKTYGAIALMVAIVYGLPIWGNPSFKVAPLPAGKLPRRALWADFELGEKPSRRVLRKILRGMSLGPVEIAAAKRERGGGEPIEVERSPALRVGAVKKEAMGAEIQRFTDAWIRRVRGFDFVLIDSLRRLAPYVDERDPEMGNVVDALRAVSEVTGCVILLLHHAVKGMGAAEPANGDRSRGRQGHTRALDEAGSGSGAIDAAAGAQFMWQKSGGPNDPRLVTQTRVSVEADDGALPPFYVALESEARGVIEILYRRKEDKPRKEKASVKEESEALQAAIKDVVRTNPGVSVNGVLLALREQDKGVRPEVLAATVDGMTGRKPPPIVNAGKLTSQGGPSKSGAKLYLPGDLPAAPPAQPATKRGKREGGNGAAPST